MRGKGRAPYVGWSEEEEEEEEEGARISGHSDNFPSSYWCIHKELKKKKKKKKKKSRTILL